LYVSEVTAIVALLTKFGCHGNTLEVLKSVFSISEFNDSKYILETQNSDVVCIGPKL